MINRTFELWRKKWSIFDANSNKLGFAKSFLFRTSDLPTRTLVQTIYQAAHEWPTEKVDLNNNVHDYLNVEQIMYQHVILTFQLSGCGWNWKPLDPNKDLINANFVMRSFQQMIDSFRLIGNMSIFTPLVTVRYYSYYGREHVNMSLLAL